MRGLLPDESGHVNYVSNDGKGKPLSFSNFADHSNSLSVIMFENLSDKLDRAFKVLKGQGTITEINVAETMKEIRKALLDADVNYKTAKPFTDDVRQKAIGANVLTSVSPGQLLTKIMNDELAELMGGTAVEVDF